LDGDNLVVAGPPGEGKTTLINLLWMAMNGRQVGEEVIQKGEKSAHITVELGDPGSPYQIKVSRIFSAAGKPSGRLKIESSNGRPLKDSFLKDLIDNLAFDPLEFIKKKGAEQTKMLFDVSNVDQKSIDELNESYDSLYQDRTSLKKEVARWENITGLEPNKVERIDIQELANQLTSTKTHNDKVTKLNDSLDNLTAELNEKLGLMEKLKAEINILSERVKKGHAIVAQYQLKDEGELVEKLKNIQEINKSASAHEDWVKNNTILKERKIELDEVVKKLENIQSNKQAVLSKAKWPVDGLSVEDGRVIYNNLPIENAGQGMALQISFAVAMSKNPTLKCCRLDGAESMGASGRADVIKMAEENGFQVLMSRVSDHGAGNGEVIIEEGVVENINKD